MTYDEDWLLPFLMFSNLCLKLIIMKWQFKRIQNIKDIGMIKEYVWNIYKIVECKLNEDK